MVNTYLLIALTNLIAIGCAENALYRILTWRGALQHVLGAGALLVALRYLWLSVPATASPTPITLIWLLLASAFALLTLQYVVLGILWVVLFAAREFSKEHMFREYIAWRDRKTQRAQRGDVRSSDNLSSTLELPPDGARHGKA